MFEEVPESSLCDHCDRIHHSIVDCQFIMHESPFLTNCAFCKEEIDSGQERWDDKFGNLYCSIECKAYGMEALVEAFADQ